MAYLRILLSPHNNEYCLFRQGERIYSNRLVRGEPNMASVKSSIRKFLRCFKIHGKKEKEAKKDVPLPRLHWELRTFANPSL